MNITTKITAFVLCFVFATFASAQTEVLDFTGWDHGLVSNGGQLFENVCGDGVDVTVTTDGVFDVDSTFLNSMDGGEAIRSAHQGPGEHSYTFMFSQAIDLELDMTILDSNEMFTVTTNGAESYMHMSGAFPTITNPVTSAAGAGILLEGNGFGLDPLSGAASGIVKASGVTSLTVSYESLADGDQFGDFLISKVVPEPGSLPLLLIGALGLLNGRRRRRR